MISILGHVTLPYYLASPRSCLRRRAAAEIWREFLKGTGRGGTEREHSNGHGSCSQWTTEKTRDRYYQRAPLIYGEKRYSSSTSAATDDDVSWRQ